MPHLKSAKKRMRQNAKRRDHNRAVKKTIKKHLRTVTDSASDAATPVDQLKAEAITAVKKLDKAAAKGVLHRNTVARRKSKIARMLNAKAKTPAAPSAAS